MQPARGRQQSLTTADLDTLYQKAGPAAFAGVRAGDHLIYIAEVGSELMPGLKYSQTRRDLLPAAGARALLAARKEAELRGFLRHRPPGEQGI